MRVAVNAAFLPPKSAGVSTYTRSLVEHLADSGHETFVYAPEDAWSSGHGTVRWRPTPESLRGGKLGSMLRVGVWYQTALPLHLVRDRTQVLLSTMQEGMLAPVCPQVVVVHDLIPLLFRGANPAWRQYYKCVLPRVLQASARVIAVSEYTKFDILRRFGIDPEKIAVVHNWLNPVFFSDDVGSPPEGHTEAPYFLYVGKSAIYKNIETVFRAFVAILPQVPHRLACVVSTTCSDDREYLTRMVELARELGITDRLDFYSGLSVDQILFLYRRATALLLLSKYEGFGYPPLEAMAVGTPAIVSDSTSLAEVAGPGAVRVRNTEPEGAAEAMRKMATCPEYRASLATLGRAHARQFSVERSGGQILRILEECADNN